MVSLEMNRDVLGIANDFPVFVDQDEIALFTDSIAF